MAEGDYTEELVEAVRQAHARRTALQIRGGNSKAHLACRLEGDVLDVSKHAGIVAYEPNELVLTARAGTRIDVIDATLAEHGQTLGFEPPRLSARSTIGGTLACNFSGPARPWRGSVRDAVLGIRLINGVGRHMRFGGRVIKNVAGFDVARLQAGAFGALGVITEISLKVVPAPALDVTIRRASGSGDAVQHMNELAATTAPISAAAWLAGHTYVRLSGSERVVEAALREFDWDKADGAIWTQLRDHRFAQNVASSDVPFWRVSVRSSADQLTEGRDTIIDWGGAQRFLRRDTSLEEMSSLAAAAGGFAMRMSHNDKRAAFMQEPAIANRALHERLKQAFDPQRILNPGRLYDWL